jgi:hypothetical protein
LFSSQQQIGPNFMIEYRAIRPQRLCRGIEYNYVAVCGMQAADAHGFPSGNYPEQVSRVGVTGEERRFHAFTPRNLSAAWNARGWPQLAYLTYLELKTSD